MGRGKQQRTIVFSAKVWMGVNGHGWFGAKDVWTMGKMCVVEYAKVCVYAPVKDKERKKTTKLRGLWRI